MMSVIDAKSCHEEDNSNLTEDDWKMPVAFQKPRHTTTIEGINCVTQTWRMKERVGSLFFLSFFLNLNCLSVLLNIKDFFY